MTDLLTVLIPILCIVESGCDPKAIGDNGKAVGILQIHRDVVTDVNARFSTKFSYEDRRDPDKSKRICELYLRFWSGQYEKRTGKKPTYEVLARIWNGGPRGYEKDSTEKYWQKVKKLIRY